MKRCLLLIFALFGLSAPMPVQPATAQASQEAAEFLQVIEMRVHVTHAPIYAAPRRNAEVVNTLAWNERILALAQTGAFYKVILPEGGPQGYILGIHLRPTSHPLHQSEMPEDLRREQRYVGARFDLQGGVAIPYRSHTFAEGYRPGWDIGARLSYPVAGPLGITARMGYRQFGEGNGRLRPLRPSTVDVRGRALSVLTGAMGVDLTAFRGHLIAFVATVDGGVYHVTVDESVPEAQNPFGATSSVMWGGSVALRLSLRLGSGARFFLEPSYEMIQTPSSNVYLFPARIGFSLER